jgi:hypothetical protein
LAVSSGDPFPVENDPRRTACERAFEVLLPRSDGRTPRSARQWPNHWLYRLAEPQRSLVEPLHPDFGGIKWPRGARSAINGRLYRADDCERVCDLYVQASSV